MRDYSKIPETMKRAVGLHYVHKVPIADLDLRREQKDNLQRVEYVYQMYLQNPTEDFFPVFYEMAKGRYKDGFGKGACTAHHFARRDELVFRYALDLLGMEQPPEHIPLNLPSK